jgi:membrane protease YdiL (CAAX protease family)
MSARIEDRSLVPLVGAALACAALALRTPGPGSLVVLAAVGVLGLSAVRAGERRASPATWLAVVGTGLAAFAMVRLSAGHTLPVVGVLPLTSAVAAAVAEEAFFRRFLYGRLLRWGAAVAVIGSAVVFAAVHVPGYGWGAGLLDVGAGLVLGWQRWATGGWTAPAVTHAAANLMAMEVLG